MFTLYAFIKKLKMEIGYGVIDGSEVDNNNNNNNNTKIYNAHIVTH